MQSFDSQETMWSRLLEFTDHPSPRRVARYALYCAAAAGFYVGGLALVGVFGGGIWWIGFGLICGVSALMLR